MNDNISTDEPIKDPLPIDPSHTSNIGEKAEEGIVSIKEGLSQQSNKWEDVAERGIPESNISAQAETYIKHPSPEQSIIEEDPI